MTVRALLSYSKNNILQMERDCLENQTRLSLWYSFSPLIRNATVTASWPLAKIKCRNTTVKDTLKSICASNCSILLRRCLSC